MVRLIWDSLFNICEHTQVFPQRQKLQKSFGNRPSEPTLVLLHWQLMGDRQEKRSLVV